MKQLVILSGKGGTGKTSVTAALAQLWEDGAVCVDADVEASNLHLLLAPRNRPGEDFVGGKVAVCDPDRCTGCGACDALCRFRAITRGRVATLACEGCGLCSLACPQQALRLVDRVSGQWFEGTTAAGYLFHARLATGAGNSGKLVALLREKARARAVQRGLAWVLTDGPPGLGCPTIAALTGNDALLAVAEPSASGLHDLARLLDLAQGFKVPAYVCINKVDLAVDLGGQIRRFCQERAVPLIGTIPYDPAVVEGARRGLPVTRWPESRATQGLRRLYRNLRWLTRHPAGTATHPPPSSFSAAAATENPL